MFIIDRHPRIEIRLDNGIYQFRGESATGKSFLCSKLKEYSIYGESVYAADYYDYVMHYDEIRSKINDYKIKVVMIDRFDLMMNSYLADIYKNKDNKIILIDYKGSLKIQKFSRCNINFDIEGITVEE